MAREFFFSYTRGNHDAYLQRFFDDLSEEVRMLRGLGKDAPVGFFDQRELELGEDWDHALVDALQTCKVMIAIGSPGYYASEYCGKEWALFAQRLRAGSAPGAALPPLLKAVPWITVPPAVLPPAVTGGQLTQGNPAAPLNTEGLRYLLKRIQDHRTAYEDFVEQLAKDIVAAGNAHPLPPLAAVPALHQVVPAFPVLPAAAGVPGAPPSPPLPAASGPGHVWLIYVAAHPSAFGDARSHDAYVDAGGADWKPFWPEHKARVHRYVQNIISDDALDFTSAALPFGADLIARIQEAWEKRQIVVLIVDPWSVHWDSQRAAPQYQSLLRQLDDRLDYHWCVLVPWNDADDVTAAARDAIAASVRGTFDKHANLAPNPMFYRDGIRSADELKKTLGEVLTRLKEEVKKRAPVTMPIAAGPSKAVVSGPSA